jgi:hypothetical protein
MSYFLYTNEDDNNNKIDIDGLFEKRQKRDLRQLSIYNKILNRVQKRIKFTSRARTNETHIWFNVPEFIFGEPIYNNGDCTGYLVAKLEEDGFHVRYIHPNTLFISWGKWIPSYVRDEIRKKTGKKIDEHGNIIEKHNKQEEEHDTNDPNSGMFNDNQNNLQKEAKQYNDTNDYKPTGKLVYTNDMFEKIEKKVSFP